MDYSTVWLDQGLKICRLGVVLLVFGVVLYYILGLLWTQARLILAMLIVLIIVLAVWIYVKLEMEEKNYPKVHFDLIPLKDLKDRDISCRICYVEDVNDLISPCKCSGSIKYVHLACFEAWLEHSSNPYQCPTCNTVYHT